MTVAICIRCGEFKHGAFTACQCGFVPETDDDLLVSLAASDHNMSVEQLKTLSEQVKDGAILKPTSADRERLADVLRQLRLMLPSRSAEHAEPTAPEAPQNKTSMQNDKGGSEVTELKLAQLLFSFNGRIGRASYLGGLALLLSPFPIAFGIGLLQGAFQIQTDISILLLPIIIPWSVLSIWIGPALSVKRLHDLDSSGWLLLAPAGLAAMTPGAQKEATAALLYLALQSWLLLAEGTIGPNDYGGSAKRRQRREKPSIAGLEGPAALTKALGPNLTWVSRIVEIRSLLQIPRLAAISAPLLVLLIWWLVTPDTMDRWALGDNSVACKAQEDIEYVVHSSFDSRRDRTGEYVKSGDCQIMLANDRMRLLRVSDNGSAAEVILQRDGQRHWVIVGDISANNSRWFTWPWFPEISTAVMEFFRKIERDAADAAQEKLRKLQEQEEVRERNKIWCKATGAMCGS